MSNSALNQQVDTTLALRQSAGAWLRSERERVGLSQTDLARKLNLEYYTFISQIENGRGKIPPTRYAEWAAALNIPSRDFAIRMMKSYDPVTYGLIFAANS